MIKAYLLGWWRYLNTEKGRHDVLDRSKALLLILLISLVLGIGIALWRGDLRL
ncbi:hypothetical protein [Azotosporobacter soli]|jgi:hypothetical protein|uniref:hypothetical protein n=1 Tax=Azotosporobacter soli TaxID=3055040 RepID=UPI0031FE9ABC